MTTFSIPNNPAWALNIQHGKHHKAYVDNANKLVEGTDLAHESLGAIVKKTAGDASKVGICNNAAQVWNHSFYWECLKPNGGGPPTGAIGQKLSSDFGGYEKFVEELKNAGITQLRALYNSSIHIQRIESTPTTL